MLLLGLHGLSSALILGVFCSVCLECLIVLSRSVRRECRVVSHVACIYLGLMLISIGRAVAH